MNKIKIGKWEVSKELFDEYIKWSMNAEGYLNKTIKTPGEQVGIISPANDRERSMRWQMCVKKIMEIHLEICEKIGVKYTSDEDDEFYIAFHKEVRKQMKLRGE